MNERNRNRIKELEAKISDLKKKQVSSVLNYWFRLLVPSFGTFLLLKILPFSIASANIITCEMINKRCVHLTTADVWVLDNFTPLKTKDWFYLQFTEAMIARIFWWPRMFKEQGQVLFIYHYFNLFLIIRLNNINSWKWRNKVTAL